MRKRHRPTTSRVNGTHQRPLPGGWRGVGVKPLYQPEDFAPGMPCYVLASHEAPQPATFVCMGEPPYDRTIANVLTADAPKGLGKVCNMMHLVPADEMIEWCAEQVERWQEFKEAIEDA